MGVDTVERLVAFAGLAGVCLGMPLGFVLGMLTRVREPARQEAPSLTANELASRDARLLADRQASTLRQRRGAL